MAKPPAGSSLLFSAISPEASIKKNKNGIFQMEIKDVESINWFTDRPQRSEGSWKLQLSHDSMRLLIFSNRVRMRLDMMHRWVLIFKLNLTGVRM